AGDVVWGRRLDGPGQRRPFSEVQRRAQPAAESVMGALEQLIVQREAAEPRLVPIVQRGIERAHDIRDVIRGRRYLLRQCWQRGLLIAAAENRTSRRGRSRGSSRLRRGRLGS